MFNVDITPFMVERPGSSTHRVQMTQTQLAPSVARRLFTTHANLTTTKGRHHTAITRNAKQGALAQAGWANCIILTQLRNRMVEK